jgi:hypothetical protein
MIGLTVRQTTIDGRTKMWKLSQRNPRISFGTSRKADLLSIDSSADTFHAVLEFKTGQWHCITFKVSDVKAKQLVTNDFSLKLEHSRLEFEVQKKQSFVLEKLQSINLIGAEQKNLVMVSLNGQVISADILSNGQNFKIFNKDKYEQIAINATDSLQETRRDGFIIQFKKIGLTSIQDLAKAKCIDLWDKDSQRSIGAVLILSLLVVGVSFLAPAKNEIANTPVTKTLNSSFVIKTQASKKKKVEQVAVARSQPASSSNSAGKASAELKSAIGIRISQLLGKVSATEARTNNVILTTKGIKAGEGASGRALAAVGKIESSGRNWNGESVAKGGGVGTVGSGGGNNTKGLGGRLGQGKTGSGGVGLIEEESEIVGGLDREVIAQYIRTQLGQILYCYERQLSASPDLFGKIAVRFTIAGTGSVETQAINDTTLKSSSVENCILNKISKWKFPEPRGGTKVLVTYPFLFKSTN